MKKYIVTKNLTEAQIAALKKAGIDLEGGRQVSIPEEVEKPTVDGLYIQVNGRLYHLTNTKWVNVEKVTAKITKHQTAQRRAA